MYYSFCFLVGKVAKVACFSRGQGTTLCLIFMFAFSLSVAEAAKEAGFMGSVQYLVYVYIWLVGTIGRVAKVAWFTGDAGV